MKRVRLLMEKRGSARRRRDAAGCYNLEKESSYFGGDFFPHGSGCDAAMKPASRSE